MTDYDFFVLLGQAISGVLMLLPFEFKNKVLHGKFCIEKKPNNKKYKRSIWLLIFLSFLLSLISFFLFLMKNLYLGFFLVFIVLLLDFNIVDVLLNKGR